MGFIVEPIFDPKVPLEAPEEGYELKPAGAMNHYHRQSREVAKHTREMIRLADVDSVLYGWRGLRNPLMAVLLNPQYGPVKAAMAQALNADFVTRHKPFVDPSRPEGYTHVVNEDDIPEQEGPVDKTKKKIEWRTNLYG